MNVNHFRVFLLKSRVLVLVRGNCMSKFDIFRLGQYLWDDLIRQL